MPVIKALGNFYLTAVSLQDMVFPVKEQIENGESLTEIVIGKNIREIREEKGLSLTQTAERAGLAKSALSKIETGRSSPPIATLLRIAKVLNVPIVRFFAPNSANPPYVLTRAGEGKNLSMQGSKFGYSYEALSLGKKDKKAEPFLLTIRSDDPKGFFYHDGQEFIYMLSGEMSFKIGNDELILRTGDSLYFDSRYTHSTKVVGNEDARFICVFI